jgi:hypothetical protein
MIFLHIRTTKGDFPAVSSRRGGLSRRLSGAPSKPTHDNFPLQWHGAAPYNRMMLKRMVTAVAVWYFVLFSSTGGVATQIGPFATQAACNDYRTQFASNGGAAPCFSTTAKQ